MSPTSLQQLLLSLDSSGCVSMLVPNPLEGHNLKAQVPIIRIPNLSENIEI
jgi:hypothetical protein